MRVPAETVEALDARLATSNADYREFRDTSRKATAVLLIVGGVYLLFSVLKLALTLGSPWTGRGDTPGAALDFALGAVPGLS